MSQTAPSVIQSLIKAHVRDSWATTRFSDFNVLVLNQFIDISRRWSQKMAENFRCATHLSSMIQQRLKELSNKHTLRSYHWTLLGEIMVTVFKTNILWALLSGTSDSQSYDALCRPEFLWVQGGTSWISKRSSRFLRHIVHEIKILKLAAVSLSRWCNKLEEKDTP